MANGFSSFAQDHHYASGLILMTVGAVGLVASVTGNLPNALAALWVPDILTTSEGNQAASGTSVGSIAGTGLNILGGPLVWAAHALGL